MGKVPTLVALVVLGTATGCSSRIAVAEVDGALKIGAKPLSRVRVMFMPDPEKGTLGPISSAVTDDQGHFQLVCADQRLGAVVGWHRVVITDLNVRLFKAGGGGQDDDDTKGLLKQKVQPSRVLDKYTTAAQTPLIVEVKADKQENHMTFELDPVRSR
jgi:hypothetical protein